MRQVPHAHWTNIACFHCYQGKSVAIIAYKFDFKGFGISMH